MASIFLLLTEKLTDTTNGDPAEQALLTHSVAVKAGSWAVQAEKCSQSSSWSSVPVTTTRASPALKNAAFCPHLLLGAWLVFMALLWFCHTRVVAYQDVAGKPGIRITLAHSHFPQKLSLHPVLLLSRTALSVPFLLRTAASRFMASLCEVLDSIKTPRTSNLQEPAKKKENVESGMNHEFSNISISICHSSLT